MHTFWLQSHLLLHEVISRWGVKNAKISAFLRIYWMTPNEGLTKCFLTFCSSFYYWLMTSHSSWVFYRKNDSAFQKCGKTYTYHIFLIFKECWWQIENEVNPNSTERQIYFLFLDCSWPKQITKMWSEMVSSYFWRIHFCSIHSPQNQEINNC